MAAAAASSHAPLPHPVRAHCGGQGRWWRALVLLLARRGADLAVTVGIGGGGDQMAAGPSRRQLLWSSGASGFQVYLLSFVRVIGRSPISNQRGGGDSKMCGDP
jgi:hypothetical protein